MESLFEVGDIVYVQGKVTSVEEQDTDVKYSVITSVARFFCTEKQDKIRRSADSQNMLNKSFNEGRDAYHTVLVNISRMTSAQRTTVFGNTVIETIITTYSAEEIIDRYSRWVKRMSLDVSDIVTYSPSSNNGSVVYDCIIIQAMAKVSNSYVNTESLSESQLANPEILSTKLLALYDPVNKIFFNGVSIDDVDPLNKKIDANKYLDEMRVEFNSVMNSEDSTIVSVTNKKDINYDNYYIDEEN